MAAAAEADYFRNRNRFHALGGNAYIDRIEDAPARVRAAFIELQRSIVVLSSILRALPPAKRQWRMLAAADLASEVAIGHVD